MNYGAVAHSSLHINVFILYNLHRIVAGVIMLAASLFKSSQVMRMIAVPHHAYVGTCPTGEVDVSRSEPSFHKARGLHDTRTLKFVSAVLQHASMSTDSHDDFKPQPSSSAPTSVIDQIKKDITDNEVLLYMKV